MNFPPSLNPVTFNASTSPLEAPFPKETSSDLEKQDSLYRSCIIPPYLKQKVEEARRKKQIEEAHKNQKD
jgi:hypothetical protein